MNTNFTVNKSVYVRKSTKLLKSTGDTYFGAEQYKTVEAYLEIWERGKLLQILLTLTKEIVNITILTCLII